MTQTKIAIGLLLGAAAGAGLVMMLKKRKMEFPEVTDEDTDWEGRGTYNIGELSEEVKTQLEKLKAAYA